MNTELTRKYAQPVPVSASTALHYRQFKNSTSVTSSLGSIPEATDLLKIKADLESLLPISEKRIKSLQRDLSFVKKNIRVREPTENEQRQLDQYTPIRKSSGKSTNPAIIEKMQIKQEAAEETSEILHTSSHNKGQIERQLALEALRRKRRRDDDMGKDFISRSESPHVKVKKYDELTPHIQRSVSPPNHKKSQHHKKKKIEVKDNKNDEVDFIRVKPKDQIPILTFWSAIDPHFRPLTEEDRAFLLPKEDDEKYYVIPSLGKHYSDVWAEDELVPPMTHSPTCSSSSSVTTILNHPLTNEDLLKPDISCGQLTERLLSSLLVDDQMKQEEEDEDEEDDDDIVDSEDIVANQIEDMLPADDLIQFEERLKRELRYVGLFGEDDVDWNTREDDEICAELRAVSKELKQQYTINEFRKKRLLSVVDNQLQYEQYRHVLDNLDVQVEQSYLKRFRNQKSKKRKAPTSSKSALSENAIHAMNKRKAWIDALEGIFKDKNMTMPTRSIYEDDDQDKS